MINLRWILHGGLTFVWNMADTTDSQYVCTLDEASIARAKAELKEDPSNRDGAVETLRKWIKEQPWLKSPTDTGFLLRFLRTKKFSQLEARKAIENYWTARTTNTLWFGNKDPTDEKIQKMLSYGFLLRLPKSDSQGRICLMLRASALDPEEVKKTLGTETIFRTIMCVMDWIGMDERVQVNGLVFIGDVTGYTSAHRSLVHTPENIKKLLYTFQNVYPMRLKSMNAYNLPPIFEAVLTIMRTFMKPKLKERMNIIGKSLVSLYEKVDMSVLPEEYLPDDYEGPNSGPVKDIIEQMKSEITKPEVVKHICGLTNGQYGVDLKLKPVEDEPAASFRKLNVD